MIAGRYRDDYGEISGESRRPREIVRRYNYNIKNINQLRFEEQFKHFFNFD
jgi:hypothetical protein